MTETEFDREHTIVSMYVDAAKSYGQLSTGALALAAIFADKLFPHGTWAGAVRGLGLASMLFLVTSLASGAFQSLAVGRLENLSGLQVRRKRLVPENWFQRPYVAYQIMAISFHLGAILLAVVAVSRLLLT